MVEWLFRFRVDFQIGHLDYIVYCVADDLEQTDGVTLKCRQAGSTRSIFYTLALPNSVFLPRNSSVRSSVKKNWLSLSFDPVLAIPLDRGE